MNCRRYRSGSARAFPYNAAPGATIRRPSGLALLARDSHCVCGFRSSLCSDSVMQGEFMANRRDNHVA